MRYGCYVGRLRFELAGGRAAGDCCEDLGLVDGAGC